MITVLVEGPGDKRAVPVIVQRERGRVSVQCVSSMQIFFDSIP